MMKEELNRELLNAFENELNDAYKVFELRRKKYIIDRDTDKNTIVEEMFSSKGIFGSFSTTEVDNTNTLYTDVKLLCLKSQIATIPVIGDIINELRVAHVGKDPVDVLWILTLRSVNGLES